MKVRDFEAERDRNHQLCVFHRTDVLWEEREQKGARKSEGSEEGTEEAKEGRASKGSSLIQERTRCIKILLYAGNSNKRGEVKSRKEEVRRNFKESKKNELAARGTKLNEMVQVFPGLTESNSFDISKKIWRCV